MSDDAPDADEGSSEADGSGFDEEASDAVEQAREDGAVGAANGEATLAARVAEYDDDLAAEVRSLVDQLDGSEERVADLESRLRRTQADFQNYKKRAKRQREELQERAAAEFIERIVPVRDNLVRALDQDADADIRPGVRATLEEFDRVLAEEGVETIEPDAGDDVDPTRHEVMMRVDSERPEGTVVDVYRPGYEMGDRVMREAQVTVSTGDDADEADEGTDDAAPGGEDADAGSASVEESDSGSGSGSGSGSDSGSGSEPGSDAGAEPDPGAGPGDPGATGGEGGR
jgi:molecular chaperone GrpE